MRWFASLFLFLLTASAAPDEKTFLVSGFDRVRIDGPFEVEVISGSTRAVAVGEAKALQRLSLRVDGGTLVISAGAEGWTQPTGQQVATPKITVYTPELRALLVNGGGRVRAGSMKGARVEIGLNGGGAVTVGAIQAEDLNVTLSGTGAMTLSGTARRARIRSNGAGGIDGGGLTAGDATLVWESAGGLRVGVRYTSQIFAMGLGTVQILGTPECRISGNGPVLCQGKIVRR